MCAWWLRPTKTCPRLADAGNFRHDLLDRLAFDVITLPPLRERPGDIVMLAEHFAIGMSVELGREAFAGFTRGAREALRQYPWPGNVRELKNVVERCVYRADPDEPVQRIVFDPFDSPYRPSPQALRASGAGLGDGENSGNGGEGLGDDGEALGDGGEALGDGGESGSVAAVAALGGGPGLSTRNVAPRQFPLDLREEMRNYEVATIQEALAAAKHNQRKAAQLLNLTYHQFRGCLRKYEILKQE